MAVPERPDTTRHTITWAQLALGMAVFGSATPVSKIVTGAFPVFVGAGLRVAIGALVLLPLVLHAPGALARLSRRDWMLTGLIAVFGMFGFTSLMLFGMAMVSGVVGAVVMSTTPAVTAAASMLFLGERPTWRTLGAIALAVAGVVILQLGAASGDEGGAGKTLLLGGLLVFAAVCCEATYTLLGKVVAADHDPVLIAFLAAALSLPLFLPLALWQWPSVDWRGIDARAWTALVWYGAGTLALGTWLWYAGIAKAEGTVAAAFMGAMPASALMLSYALLGEAFAWTHLAGFAVVFAGVMLISWEHARASDARGGEG